MNDHLQRVLQVLCLSDRLLCRSVGPYRVLDPQKGDCAYPHLSLSALVCLDFNLLLPSGNLAFSVSSLPLPFTWAKAWSPLSILLSFSAKTLTSLADSRPHDTLFDSSRSLLLNFHRLLLDCRHLSPTDPTDVDWSRFLISFNEQRRQRRQQHHHALFIMVALRGLRRPPALGPGCRCRFHKFRFVSPPPHLYINAPN